MARKDPRHVTQFDGSAYQRQNCTAAVGAMELDAATNGASTTTGARIRALQDDQVGGIGLDDVAVALRRGWGLSYSQGKRSWATIQRRLADQDGAGIQGLYAAVPSAYRVQKDFRGGHAVYVSRYSSPGQVLVHDPISRTGAVIWPEWVLRAFYLSGLATAGWSIGSAQVPATGIPTSSPGGQVGQVTKIATATNAAAPGCAQVTILAPGPLGAAQKVIPIPRESIGDPCVECPTGWAKAWYAPSPLETIVGWVPLDQTGGKPNACVAPGVKVGDSGPAANLGGAAGEAAAAAGAAASAAANTLLAGLGEALSPVLFLAAILALILVGLYFVAKSEG
jgi:hypothetical protein